MVRSFAIGPVEIDPPVLQAPMAGFTNSAYRQIIRRLGGVGLPATEMVSARGILGAEARGAEEVERLQGVADEPRPLAVQVWDNDPGVLAAVGRRLAYHYRVSVVDINFGCPVRDVSEKARSGAYLLGDPQRIGRIVAAVAAACAPVPVTAKIRLGAAATGLTPSTWPRPWKGPAGRQSPFTAERRPTDCRAGPTGTRSHASSRLCGASRWWAMAT